jgi:hypothetical protein
MKNIGKPCTGKLYARFDEGGQGSLLSTLPEIPGAQRHSRLATGGAATQPLSALHGCSILNRRRTGIDLMICSGSIGGQFKQ